MVDKRPSDDGDAGLVRRPRTPRRRSKISVLPASTDSAVAPADRIAWIVATPTTGTSKRMSWFGFATLTMRHAGAGQLAGARDHFVGAFHRLDRDDGLVLDGDRSGRCRGRQSRRPSRSRTRSPSARRRSARASSARPRRPAAARSNAVESISSIPRRAARPPPRRSARRCSRASAASAPTGTVRSGMMPPKDLGVLDLPGHHRLRDAGA